MEEPTTINIVDALTTAVSDIQAQLGEVVPLALGVAVAILVATIGWKLFKRFVRG